MAPRERVIQAIRFEQTDIVPYQIGFTNDARQMLARYYGDNHFDSTIGNHLASISHRRLAPWVEGEPGFFRDEWGVIWNKTIDRDIGIVANQVLSEPHVGDYQFPNPASPGLFESYPAFVEENRDKFRMASLGISLFERAWALRGFEQILIDMHESPDFVHELLDRITEFNLAQIDLALRHDIDCVWTGDDWGSQSGLLMSPAMWREFIKPRAQRMYERAHKAGKWVMVHSCGKIEELLPDLVEAGVNICNPFQPETMDVFEVKRRYHGRMSFYGGISVQKLLPFGTPSLIRDETRRLLNELGKGGGYIASSSHVITADIPPENAVAMIEVLRGQ